MATSVIKQLTDIRGLKVECPHCDESFSIKRARLFNMHASYPRLALKRMDERSRLAAERIVELKARREQLQFDIQTRPKRVSVGSESSHFGKISEQILPAFATFPYKHRDCRIMLMPVDYVVFSGLHAKNLVESIIFVDVKTGAGRLSPDQKQISHNIVAGKLEHTVIGK